MNPQIATQIELQIENRNRMTVFFRAFLTIPIFIFVSSFNNYSALHSNRTFGSGTMHNFPAATLTSLLFGPIVLALLFRGIYPSYLFQLYKGYYPLLTRVSAYVLLLTDDYPSIEANEKIRVEFPDIQGGRNLSRGLPLVKWFLAIPLYVVGFVYGIYSLMLTLVAWFTIVFSGRYPDWCASGVIGTIAYWNRVFGYAFVLVTDEYPSFSL